MSLSRFGSSGDTYLTRLSPVFYCDWPEISLGLVFHSVLLIVDKDYVLSEENVMGMLWEIACLAREKKKRTER